MPPAHSEPTILWKEHYAWWPVRSNWSKKLLWLTTYYEASIFFDVMGRPPIKGRDWKLIYSKQEYLLYLLRKKPDATISN